MGLTPRDAFTVLPMTLRDDLLSAFNEIVTNYRERKWEPSELNGGKVMRGRVQDLQGLARRRDLPRTSGEAEPVPRDLLGDYEHLPAGSK